MDLTFAPPSNSFAHYHHHHHHHDSLQSFRYDTAAYHQSSYYATKQIWPSNYSSPPLSPSPHDRPYHSYPSDPDCDDQCMTNNYYARELSLSTVVSPKPEPLTPDATMNGPSSRTTIVSCNGTETRIVGGRVVKKRNTANKKERRRTLSINSAFANLRDCIPNVPADTKLSKIKTLRLATSYIAYLMELLDGPSETSCKLLTEGFRADLSCSGRRAHRDEMELTKMDTSNGHRSHTNGKVRCRTGWPQHVWALELKQHDS